jgi:Fimbrial assembly protein (PilN)
VVDEVSRVLPDDTWLTQFEMKSLAKGKETQREILVRGETANAGRLVQLVEESPLFAQTAPRSPTTKIQPGPGEIFDLGAQLKPLPAPVQIALAAPEKVAEPAPTTAETAAAPASPAAVAPETAAAPPPAPGAPAPDAAPAAQPPATEPQPAPAPAAPRPSTLPPSTPLPNLPKATVAPPAANARAAIPPRGAPDPWLSGSRPQQRPKDAPTPGTKP